MKKKSHNDSDIVGIMNKIQAQLAVLDRKLDAFMTKSLTELAQARVAHVAPKPQPVAYSAPVAPRPNPSRPMFAVVCFECGKDTEIPFKPAPGRPVYCKECFAKRRAGNAPKVGDATPSIAPAAPVVTPAVAKKPSVVKKAAKKAPAKKVVAKKKAKKR